MEYIVCHLLSSPLLKNLILFKFVEFLSIFL